MSIVSWLKRRRLDDEDFQEEIRAHGVSATDAVSFERALAIVLGVVLVATIVPAWRAARTNPLSALRHQ